MAPQSRFKGGEQLVQHNPLPPIWIYPDVDVDWVSTIAAEFTLHPATAQLLAARGFRTIQEVHHFLYAKLPDLYDPYLLPDMDKAVKRIFSAMQSNESILICGDNDMDGITAATLLTEFLRFLEISTFYYIPSRTTLQQSVMLDAITFAQDNQCTLLITVDCGITAAVEIENAVANKIDVIVTDHHEPTDRLPHCIATLNPKLQNSPYPDRHLTGVGVAFKLAHAMTDFLLAQGEISAGRVDLKRYLDLVALGTISDMGSLIGENRILVRYGLQQIRKTRRHGLSKLCAICGIKLSEVTPTDIASKIAPRLNSLGRIADSRKGVELFLLRDPIIGEALAKELDLHNTERQKIERTNSADVEHVLRKELLLTKDKAIVLESERWHPGIIPIITARTAKQYNRPTVIIVVEGGFGKGSIRTIPEFPLLSVLRECGYLLENFGGHDYAAGLTIKKENIPLFKAFFIAKANTLLSDEDILPKLRLDGELGFNELTFDFMESLSLCAPFGQDNPLPIFHCNVKQTRQPKVIGKLHLKCYLEHGERLMEGIGFGLAYRKEELQQTGRSMRIAFTPQVNKANIQLILRDFQLL
jgi:single-stranded-DNA-specific exonuclease